MPKQDNFGCWECGSTEGRVTYTARDEDGHPIRRRKCAKCGGVWITEETRLARGVTFGQRAYTAYMGQRRRRATASRTCRFCGGRWMRGSYPHHVAKSRIHLAWKAERAEYWRQYKADQIKRRYQSDPVFRRQQIDGAVRRKKEQRNAGPERNPTVRPQQVATRFVDSRLATASDIGMPGERDT